MLVQDLNTDTNDSMLRRYTVLQTKNSTRNFFAMNLVAMEMWVKSMTQPQGSSIMLSQIDTLRCQ